MSIINNYRTVELFANDLKQVVSDLIAYPYDIVESTRIKKLVSLHISCSR